eukprot:m.140424 g.140424  ORF g.140424 m.140424 type:complete len:359 (+) comp38305_c0_seq1:1152-2228(+)
MRSQTTSHMVIEYVIQSEDTGAIAQLSYRKFCLTESTSQQTTEWLTANLDSHNNGTEMMKCIQILNDDDIAENTKCDRFQVIMQAHVPSGNLTVVRVDFGGSTICPTSIKQNSNIDSNVRTNATCDFGDGDCGFRNDACGLYQWQVGTVQAKAGGTTTVGTPLLMEENQKECTYSVCIPCFQPSGFSEKNGHLETTSTAQPKDTAPAKKRTTRLASSFVLYLDPLGNLNKSSIAVGVFNVPQVVHHPQTAILTFSYTFFASGRHQIVVGALCFDSGRTFYVRLGGSFKDVRVSNFQISVYAKSGRKCLDLHKFIKKQTCPHFVIQFQGAAQYSPLAINSVQFHTTAAVNTSHCRQIDN